MTAMERYNSWLAAPWLDEDSRAELAALTDEKEIEDRFYREMEFGTAGMRGVLAAGLNRMNVYTVRRASKGLADYIVSCGAEAAKRGVAIAYDSRKNSDVFAKETAAVLCAAGVNVYLYESLRPVPQLSFALRHLGCIGGVVITASHNPAIYNGYKVYWEDGGQIPPDHVKDVVACIDKIQDFGAIPTMDLEEAKAAGLLTIIGKEVDDVYIERVKGVSVRPDLLAKLGDEFKVVYTPLHGTGNIPVRRVLAELGLKNVFVVPEQEMPDSAFSTVRSPNPEDHDAFNLAIELAEKVGADIVLGTDPDCDRLGVLVKNEGQYTVLTGNQTACLILNYILTQMKEAGTLPENGAVVKTIVSTDLAKTICDAFGVTTIDVLTGFKFIAEQIAMFEETGKHTFLFGFEESYGCLAGTFVRDKDAVIASMLAVEVAAWYRSRGMTLYDGIQELYKTYGYSYERTISFTMPGKDGMEKMANTMSAMRENTPWQLGDVAVSAVRDYQTSIRTTAEGATEEIPIVKSNVLFFELDAGAWAVVRPSGTEPKIKVYFSAQAPTMEAAVAKVDGLQEAFMNIMKPYME
ncbi:MAG: phospho-sugar mutase [Clostridia bacterium]|nr:phospho-sugar mutase [Clostridia bacterium]